MYIINIYIYNAVFPWLGVVWIGSGCQAFCSKAGAGRWLSNVWSLFSALGWLRVIQTCFCLIFNPDDWKWAAALLKRLACTSSHGTCDRFAFACLLRAGWSVWGQRWWSFRHGSGREQLPVLLGTLFFLLFSWRVPFSPFLVVRCFFLSLRVVFPLFLWYIVVSLVFLMRSFSPFSCGKSFFLVFSLRFFFTLFLWYVVFPLVSLTRSSSPFSCGTLFFLVFSLRVFIPFLLICCFSFCFPGAFFLSIFLWYVAFPFVLLARSFFPFSFGT